MTTYLKKVFFCALILPLTAGCAAAPAQEEETDMRRLLAANAVKHRSTKQEILHLFGEPQHTAIVHYTHAVSQPGSETPHEMWAYTWPDGTSSRPKGLERMGWRRGGRGQDVAGLKTMVLGFDRNGRLLNYSLSEGSV